ncbi:ATP synthase F1 subunit epsilon [Pontibacter sp. G13]|uniref:ATP synthase F1 subunit epsilon n=1 Tax=Pontibacter sp. G13 TaxID=3074898 RepID=UPI00288BFB73|nr:ATP synthase F1 subunit epsilon [Pontibacter sp. G13]WNJ18699.1 ATP synthase F1 subunit epsilon [Pontibacter sp. G13]
MKHFDLEIVTPESNIFSGLVESVSVPGSQGSFQVLFNHAPIIATLGKGKVKVVTESGENLTFNAEGGVVEVMNNKTNILVERLIEA